MADPDERVLPVDRTLTRVVLLMRLLSGVWLIIIAVVVLARAQDNPDLDVAMVVAIMIVGAAGTALTFVAAKQRFLDATWYLILDSAITLFLAAGGLLASHDGFIVGGYPASLLFVVAYATNFRTTVVVGVAGTVVMGYLHILLDLEPTRTFGSIQYVVVAAVVGWGFENLRKREFMRLVAEEERAEAERELAEEQRKTARLEERTVIARRLHDSVLQTLKLISVNAEDASEVRYLARVQERDLRRTINEYQSPYQDSFRARLLDARAEVEDRYRVEIEQVIKDDAEMDDRLRAAVDAAAEALNNAARHSGVASIDLFAEIRDGQMQIHVRDRGTGFDSGDAGTGIRQSIRDRVESVGGSSAIKTAPGRGTEVQILLPMR